MIKLKHTFGNVKCKIESEYMVSKYEISILQTQRMNGLLAIKDEKNGEIVYEGDTKKSLAQLNQKGLDRELFLNVLKQVSNVVFNIKKMGLSETRLILNPEWIYVSEKDMEVQMIYCPVNGCGVEFDFVLFVKDLLIVAKIDVDIRNEVEKWIEEIQNNGITAYSVEAIAVMAGKRDKTLKASYDVVHKVMIDEEAPTGLDEDEEAPTGIDEEDDEPRTGMENGDYIRDVLDKADGTWENTSESGRYSKRPTLYCKTTSETICISKNEFKLGRSQQRADYCIINNNSVSNIHATIFTYDGLVYYIKDNHSTNGTTVNGVTVDPNGSGVVLNEGANINLFNEEFEFHC